MKNISFVERLNFAVQGIKSGWKTESSFRIQVCSGLLALAILSLFQAEPIWWAVFILTIGAVLAAELVNTSLEKALDCLHPEKNPLIGIAKDCAAGAVLVLSFSSVGILIAFCWSKVH